jgi:hypothetical protein
MEIVSIVSALAGTVCIFVAMGGGGSEYAWLAVECFGSFIALRAVALGLRLLDDIRLAIVARARAEAEEVAHPSWEEEP